MRHRLTRRTLRVRLVRDAETVCATALHRRVVWEAVRPKSVSLALRSGVETLGGHGQGGFGEAEARHESPLLGLSAGASGAVWTGAGLPSVAEVMHCLGNRPAVAHALTARRIVSWELLSTEPLSNRFGASLSRPCGPATTPTKRSDRARTQCRPIASPTTPPMHVSAPTWAIEACRALHRP